MLQRSRLWPSSPRPRSRGSSPLPPATSSAATRSATSLQHTPRTSTELDGAESSRHGERCVATKDPMTRALNALGRHLALVGFMGAGKSTIAPKVAERLGRRVVEADRLLE